MAHATVAYQTRKGAHMTKMFRDADSLSAEIQRLWRRRTYAEAWVNDDRGNVIASVWKDDYNGWTWFCDMECLK